MHLVAFAREPHGDDLHRPFAGPAIYGTFLGAILHTIARVGANRGTAAT